MKSKNTIAKQLVHGLSGMLTLAVIAGGQAASAQSYKVIHDFALPGGSYRFADGANPSANLISDTHGNLFGVTPAGGDNNNTGCDFGCGTVFELSPTSAGGWKETVLHRFRGSSVGNNQDGANPQGGLVFDSAGNLYGTTASGGSGGNVGTVFELSPTSSGGWTYSILYSFQDGADGATPLGKLTIDASGNLYGTAQGGGSSLFGVVFELSPTSTGGWNETPIISFDGFGEGAYPNGGLVFDAAGRLYGTTSYGGNAVGYAGFGVVFRLSPISGGGWALTTLIDFDGTQGATPSGGLIFDPTSGDFFGTTLSGGNLAGCGGLGCGVVYKLSPTPSGGLRETVLRTFEPGLSGNGDFGGAASYAGLTQDALGNLYGTTTAGGRQNVNKGVVFKLSPNATGGWTEKVLHAFFGGTDGGEPTSSVILDGAGNLFGTALYGGIASDCGGNGCGVVFEITP